MELSERYLQQLEKEDVQYVYEQFDEPNHHYPLHSHPYSVTILISEGEMEVTIEGKTTKYGSTERLDIPAHTKHSATAGPEGCKYVVGERA